jgi:uncharacterized damage-inducible protein DinB
MQPLKTYDYLTRSRAIILDAARPLSHEKYHREFPIGPGSLARTLTHTLGAEWYYIERMLGHQTPPYDECPIREEDPFALPDLAAEWDAQAARTRAALDAVADWDAPISYTVEYEGKRVRVTASASDLFTQLALHEMHHRAQALNILRHLGVTFDRDLDYNAMMYTRVEF